METIPRECFPLLLHYHPLHLYRYQICKQADPVLAHCILEDAQPKETIRRSFEYYEKITTHDSSLSKSIFCIVAARLDMIDKAFDYFGDSLYLDLLDHQRNTRDAPAHRHMGGNYMAIVYGFGGFRIKEDGVYFTPALPKDWKGYQFHIRYRGSLINIEVYADHCAFYLESGPPQKITVLGGRYSGKPRYCGQKGECMKYRAVIFDLDGVICHTDCYHNEAWGRSARNWGCILTRNSPTGCAAWAP